jgi:hypothetical protein
MRGGTETSSTNPDFCSRAASEVVQPKAPNALREFLGRISREDAILLSSLVTAMASSAIAILAEGPIRYAGGIIMLAAVTVAVVEELKRKD